MNERKRSGIPKGQGREKTQGVPIDHLLQQTFKDDIPPDVERALKRQLELFRTRMERTATERTWADRKALRAVFRFRDIQWIHFLFKKEILIFVSLVMIVLGGFIQSSGTSNKLSENLSVLGTSLVASSQMSRSHSMECSIQMLRENQKPLLYSIQWLSPDRSKIQVKENENTLLKTIWFMEGYMVVADHEKDTLNKQRLSEPLSDPILQPILGYLTPTVLVERIFGEWQLLQYQQQEECRQGIYTVSLADERETLEVTIDLCSYLPVTIQKTLPAEENGEKTLILDIHYRWDVPLSLETMSPPPMKESQKV